MKVLFSVWKTPTPLPCRMIVTDAPYGISYAARRISDALNSGNRVQKPIANDHDPGAAPSDILRGSAPRIQIFRGASCYATVPGGPLLPDFIGAFNQSGFSFKSLLVWAKN